MKELILENFSTLSGNLSIKDVVLNFSIAFLLGLVIYIAYRFSHSGAVYSARFNVSLIELTLITTLVMSVIGNNIALSLGMVGALSIVRFRTAIKDPRDTTFIFWCIAIGISCGVSDYLIAAVGTGFIFIVMLLFGAVKANDRYLLIIQGAKASSERIERQVLVLYKGNSVQRVKNTTAENVEYIYEMSSMTIEKSKKYGGSIDELYKIDGVTSVNLVCQNEEVSR